MTKQITSVTHTQDIITVQFTIYQSIVTVVSPTLEEMEEALLQLDFKTDYIKRELYGRLSTNANVR